MFRISGTSGERGGQSPASKGLWRIVMNDSSIKILVAEDDFLVAKFLEEELKLVGITVIGRANNGLSAVELTCSLKPSVVLMDMQMPDMNGIDAAIEIQKRQPTPIIMLTVYNETEIVYRAAEAGVAAYLIKPATGEEVCRAIYIAQARFNDMMELRRVNEELQQALASVKKLSGFLPICSNCKKIRNDQGEWLQIEEYIREHSSAKFTHSLCPFCMMKYYPGEASPDSESST
jgi:two-component system, response regulator PdtaR